MIMNQKVGRFPWIASDQKSAAWALPEGTVARLGQGGVTDMAVSPDTKYLVLGTEIGLWWYELETLSPLALWDTECSKVSAVAFSPSGEWIATGHRGGVIKIWDIQRGVCFTQMRTERQGRLARTETWPQTFRHLIFFTGQPAPCYNHQF